MGAGHLRLGELHNNPIAKIGERIRSLPVFHIEKFSALLLRAVFTAISNNGRGQMAITFLVAFDLMK